MHSLVGAGCVLNCSPLQAAGCFCVHASPVGEGDRSASFWLGTHPKFLLSSTLSSSLLTGTLKRSRGAATLLGGRTLIGDETGASSFTSSSNTTTTGPAAEWGAEEASAQHVKGGAEGEGDSKRGGGDGSGGAASDMFGGGYTGDGGGGGGSSRGITVISSTNAVDDFNRMLRVRVAWAISAASRRVCA